MNPIHLSREEQERHVTRQTARDKTRIECHAPVVDKVRWVVFVEDAERRYRFRLLSKPANALNALCEDFTVIWFAPIEVRI